MSCTLLSLLPHHDHSAVVLDEMGQVRVMVQGQGLEPFEGRYQDLAWVPVRDRVPVTADTLVHVLRQRPEYDLGDDFWQQQIDALDES